MEDLPPEEIWRCIINVAVAFMWFNVLAYNLLNWFRLALLPAGASGCEITTIRRLILNVPGNVVGNGHYRHVRLAPNAWLKGIVKKSESLVIIK